MKLHGIYVPNVMPLHADGRINEILVSLGATL